MNNENLIEKKELPEAVEESEVSQEVAVNNNVLGNTLLLMQGKYGGGFHVRYIYDRGTGHGWLQLVIVYPTGTIKTQLLCKNVCKCSSYEEDGLGEVEGVSYAHKESGELKVFKPPIYGSQEHGMYNILRAYERPDMPIPMSSIWQRIVENYDKIPIVELVVKSSLRDVYESLVELGENLIQRDITRAAKDCILLTKAEVEEVASKMGYSLAEVRAEFALRGLWATDKNFGSYQKTKKIGGVNRRFYALRISGSSVVEAETLMAKNIEYSERLVPTRESVEIEKLRGELASMKAHKSELYQLICERVPDLTQEEIFKRLL